MSDGSDAPSEETAATDGELTATGEGGLSGDSSASSGDQVAAEEADSVDVDDLLNRLVAAGLRGPGGEGRHHRDV